jgi:hypothetical protein
MRNFSSSNSQGSLFCSCSFKGPVILTPDHPSVAGLLFAANRAIEDFAAELFQMRYWSLSQISQVAPETVALFCGGNIH